MTLCLKGTGGMTYRRTTALAPSLFPFPDQPATPARAWRVPRLAGDARACGTRGGGRRLFAWRAGCYHACLRNGAHPLAHGTRTHALLYRSLTALGAWRTAQTRHCARRDVGFTRTRALWDVAYVIVAFCCGCWQDVTAIFVARGVNENGVP